MQLPHTLKRWNVFADGDSWAGQAEEIELPKLTKKTEEHRGAGMITPAPVILGYEKMELTITTGGLIPSAVKQFSKCEDVMLRFAGAYQRDDNCDVLAGEIIVRGKFVEWEPGTAKEGDKNTPKLMMHLHYYKMMIDGETILTVDAYNPVVGPEESGSNAIRSAIGL